MDLCQTSRFPLFLPSVSCCLRQVKDFPNRGWFQGKAASGASAEPPDAGLTDGEFILKFPCYPTEIPHVLCLKGLYQQELC